MSAINSVTRTSYYQMVTQWLNQTLEALSAKISAWASYFFSSKKAAIPGEKKMQCSVEDLSSTQPSSSGIDTQKSGSLHKVERAKTLVINSPLPEKKEKKLPRLGKPLPSSHSSSSKIDTGKPVLPQEVTSRKILATKSQYTDKNERVTSCCANAMKFLEMLYQRSSSDRLKFTPKNLNHVIDTGYQVHLEAIDLSNKGLQEIKKVTQDQYKNDHPNWTEEEINKDVKKDLCDLARQISFEGQRFSPTDLASMFTNFETNNKVNSYANTPLSKNKQERIDHFKAVFNDLEKHLAAAGGVIGSTVTCNNQTYSLFIAQDEKGVKQYGVFDSHGTKEKAAFAFYSTSLHAAAKQCEVLAGYQNIQQQLDQEIIDLLKSSAQSAGLTDQAKINDFVEQKAREMSSLPEDANQVSYHYLLPKR